MTTATRAVGGPRPRSRRACRAETVAAVRGFVLDGDPRPAAWVPTSRLAVPTLTYLHVGATFERHGMTRARSLVGPVVDDGRRRGDDRVTAYCARSAAWRILGLARTVGGRHLCLHESLGLCAALRRLGFGVQVVIGYPLIELASGEEELHAWPALGHWPLTGRADGEPVSYQEIDRFPDATPGPAGGSSC